MGNGYAATTIRSATHDELLCSLETSVKRSRCRQEGETLICVSKKSGGGVIKERDGCRFKRRKRHVSCSITKSKAVTTALTCSQRRLNMTASDDTLKQWDVSSR